MLLALARESESFERAFFLFRWAKLNYIMLLSYFLCMEEVWFIYGLQLLIQNVIRISGTRLRLVWPFYVNLNCRAPCWVTSRSLVLCFTGWDVFILLLYLVALHFNWRAYFYRSFFPWESGLLQNWSVTWSSITFRFILSRPGLNLMNYSWYHDVYLHGD